MIQLFEPFIAPEASQRVAEVLKSGWISEGKLVKDFEQSFMQYFDQKACVAVNSCTSALHLALILANVKPGDEVILPAQTFVATGIAVLMVGATPVFADIDYETGNISVGDVRQKITDKTKAIIGVDWAGSPCDIEGLLQFRIPVIEDAAQAIDAGFRQQDGTFYKVGREANFTCFSFQAIKQLTTGDGGMLCLGNPYDIFRAKKLRWFGSRKGANKDRCQDIVELGYKYNMNDYSAALGLANIRYVKNNVTHARRIHREYLKGLSGVTGIRFLKEVNESYSSYWFQPILVETMDAESFVSRMEDHDIHISRVDLRIDNNPIFQKADLPNTVKFNQHHVGLPTHHRMSDDDVQYVIDTIKYVVKFEKEL